jgi:hypothetical protein
MADTKPIHRIAIIGTGVIGANWTALCYKRVPAKAILDRRPLSPPRALTSKGANVY